MSKANPVARVRAAALAKIEREQGRLVPSEIVDIAASESHELHDYFEWDDSEAGKLYRIEQARTLIREVKVVFESRNITMVAPFYIADPDPNRGQNSYVQLEPLRRQKDNAQRIMRDEIARIEGAITRARAVAAKLDLEDQCQAMIEAIACLRRALDDAA